MEILDENNKRASQPPGIKQKLMDHQLAMLNKCIEIENLAKKFNFPFGVLYGKVGSGKTAIIISLALIDKYIFKRSENLIAVPQNIYHQWIDEIERFAGGVLSVKKLDNYTDIQELYYNSDVFKDFDIVLTTTSYLNVVFEVLSATKVKINRVVLDEIDTNTNSIKHQKNVLCNICWLVSASIHTLNDKEFKLLDYKIEPKRLEAMTTYCSENFIQKSFKVPDYKVNKIVVDSIVDKFSNALPKKYLYDLNCCNYDTTEKDFLTSFIKNTINEVQSLSVKFNEVLETRIKNDRHKIIVDNLKKKITQDINTNEKYIKAFVKVCNENSLCMHCLHTVGESPLYDDKYHFMMCNKCPETLTQFKNKLQAFEDLIAPFKNKKVIIFAKDFVSFKHFINILKKKNFQFISYDGGNVEDINKRLNEFKTNLNEKESKFLLMDFRQNVFGLNLEIATDIILLHKLDESIEPQVIGRAQRFPRKNTLIVHKLLNKNES